MDVPPPEQPKSLEFFAAAVLVAAKSANAELPSILRDANLTLPHSEWQNLAADFATKIDGARSLVLASLVTPENGKFAWPVDEFFAEVLARLDFELGDMLVLIASAIEARGPADHWTVAKGFENWCLAGQARAFPSVEAIAGGLAPTVLLPAALRAGVAQQFDRAWSIGISLIEGENEDTAILACEVLANCSELTEDQVSSLTEVMVQRYERVATSARPKLFEVIIGFALRANADALPRIMQLVDYADLAPYRQACARQFYLGKTSPDLASTGLIFDLLCGEGPLDPESVNLIDDGIRRWISNPIGEVGCLDGLYRLIVDAGIEFVELDASIHAVLQLEVGKRDMLFARLLASGKFKGIHAVYQVALKAFSRPLEPEIDFSPFDLNTVQASQIARQVAGLFAILPVTATAILLSLLRSGPSEADHEIENLIFDPILISYWEDAREFLERRLPVEVDSLARTIRALVGALDRYIKGIKDAGFINEMYPSERMRFLRALKRDADSRKISRQGQEQSVLANLFPSRLILNGDSAIFRVFSGEGDGQRAEQEMQSVAHSHALPRLDAIDPFGYWYRRRHLINGHSG